MNSSADTPSKRLLEQGFLLDGLRIDPLEGQVSGPRGRETLDPKVMHVLVMLAQHAGKVVSREDLLTELWPNVVVSDDVLSRCIYELRRQLSQAGGNERYKVMFETLPKRGYRLNGEVVPAQKLAGSSAPKLWRLPRAAALAAAILILALLWFAMGKGVVDPSIEPPRRSATEAAPSIAVLPFVDMSAGQDQGFLADGMSEEILNQLAQIPGLRVIARTSSFAFRGQQVSIPDIAAKLNVSHVLEGSVRRSGDHLRITAQLIAASDNAHAWSATFDRELRDLFTVQDEIAVAVASALRLRFADLTRSASMPVNTQALEHFLRGQFLYNRRSPGDVERSAKYFDEAVAIDPGFARAWAALSGVYGLLAWDGQTFKNDLQVRQGDAARKAVELDPRLAVAHARLSRFYYDTQDFAKAEQHERQAAALDPNDPLVLGAAADDAVASGNLGNAVMLLRRAVARDPLSPTQRNNLANLLFADGRLDEAMAEFRGVRELNPAAGLDIDLEIFRILVLQRRYDAAQSAIEKLPAGNFHDQGAALLYEAPGRLAEADLALARLAAQPADTMDRIRLADVYAFRGMPEKAIALLQKERDRIEHEIDLRRPRIWDFQNELRVSFFLKPLHSDPRWTALMARPAIQ